MRHSVKYGESFVLYPVLNSSKRSASVTLTRLEIDLNVFKEVTGVSTGQFQLGISAYTVVVLGTG